MHFYLIQFDQGCFENIKGKHFSHIHEFGMKVCTAERLVVNGQGQMC